MCAATFTLAPSRLPRFSRIRTGIAPMRLKVISQPAWNAVFVAATDSHAAQARVNQIALALNKPAVFVGVYEGGGGGEVDFWRPGPENDEAGAGLPTSLTLVTGPSKTADIEGILITGVHGPRAVHVIVIDGA